MEKNWFERPNRQDFNRHSIANGNQIPNRNFERSERHFEEHKESKFSMLIKRPTFIFIAVVAILIGFTYSLSSFASIESCIAITDTMTIKKANEIAEVCKKEIADLQLQHDGLSKQQKDLQVQADERRKLLWENPVIKEDVKKKVSSADANWYIHQTINPLPNVWWATPKERFENLVKHYWKVDPSVFIEVWREYKIAEELLACIAYAESHIWTHLKATNNIMNYGNNDRWNKVPYITIKANVQASAHWLKFGTYLSKNKILGELSNWGRLALGLPTCENRWTYCYATSWVNWRGNVNDCMTFIHWENKDWDNYVF